MKKLFIPICIALFFCSCEQEQDLVTSGGTPAAFLPAMESGGAAEGSVATRGEAATGTGTLPAATRVVDNLWSGKETVGIAAFNAAGGTQYTSKYHKYVPKSGQSNTTRVQLIPATGETAILYPMNGDELTFTAFAPYPTDANATLAEASKTVTYYLNKQGTTTNIMEKLDFIHHKGTEPFSQQAPVAALNFKHKLSRVIINLTRGANYTTSIANSTAVINGVYTSVACNIADGTVTPAGNDKITPFRTTNAANSQVFQAIVAPQSSTSTPAATARKLTLTIASKTYDVEIPQDWAPGISYTYDLVFDATGVSLAGSTVVNWGAGTIAWNGEYYLTLSESEVNLYKEAVSNQTLSIKTNHTGNVTYTRSDNVDPKAAVGSNYTWLTVNSLTGNATTGWTMTYSAAANESGAARTAYVHIKVGTVVTATVKVVQSGDSAPTAINEYLQSIDANCFIVPPGGTAVVPAMRAFINEYFPLTSYTSLHATVLWTDVQDLIPADNVKLLNDGINSVIEVKTNPSAGPGNGVIALRANSATGTIYWSWHIWVTDDPTARTYSYTSSNGTFVFMDRDIGATRGAQQVDDVLAAGSTFYAGVYATIGLYYQWGRKDPFTGFKSWNNREMKQRYSANGTPEWPSSIALGDTYVTMADAIQAPHVKYNTSNMDWCRDHIQDEKNTWNHADGSKSLVDPCPARWKLPTIDTYGFLDELTRNGSDGGGFVVGASSWWPLEDHILEETYVSSTGNSTDRFTWLNTERSDLANAHVLYNITCLNRYERVSRARALNVRCVAEH